MCLGDGVDRSMDCPSIRPSIHLSVTRYALQITRDLCNIMQLSNAKQSCANFHIPVYECNAARGSRIIINQLSCPEPRAWCRDRDMEYVTSCTTKWLMIGKSFFKFIDSSKLHQKSRQLYRTTTAQNVISHGEAEITTRLSCSCELRVQWMEIQRSPRTKNAVLVPTEITWLKNV